MYSLTCSLSSTRVKYKASTQRQIQHKNSTNKPKRKQYHNRTKKSNTNKVLGQKSLTLKNIDNIITKCNTLARILFE